MFFVFGERVHGASLDAGERLCPICRRSTHFAHIVETNYFCIFGLRLLPVEKVANYYQCSECGNPFDRNVDVPNQVSMIAQVLAYILAGYGMTAHQDVAAEVCRKVSGFDISHGELAAAIRSLASGRENLFDLLKAGAQGINATGAHQIVQAAFLMTHVCCEIQYEDRLRINLIGNAVGISLAFVEMAVEAVREKKYYGVHRLLGTVS
ncbi:MAG TPA: hypothetical protein VJ998_12700 [Pseudomonadales bacterium]|nr:hypothetical protein [Pseudomonadales bacterium]